MAIALHFKRVIVMCLKYACVLVVV